MLFSWDDYSQLNGKIKHVPKPPTSFHDLPKHDDCQWWFDSKHWMKLVTNQNWDLDGAPLCVLWIPSVFQHQRHSMNTPWTFDDIWRWTAMLNNTGQNNNCLHWNILKPLISWLRTPKQRLIRRPVARTTGGWRPSWTSAPHRSGHFRWWSRHAPRCKRRHPGSENGTPKWQWKYGNIWEHVIHMGTWSFTSGFKGSIW